jgi:hypothetical protein
MNEDSKKNCGTATIRPSARSTAACSWLVQFQSNPPLIKTRYYYICYMGGGWDIGAKCYLPFLSLWIIVFLSLFSIFLFRENPINMLKAAADVCLLVGFVFILLPSNVIDDFVNYYYASIPFYFFTLSFFLSIMLPKL